MALVGIARVERQPDAHAVGAAAEPQRLRQVRLLGAGRARVRHPQDLHRRRQHRRRRVRRPLAAAAAGLGRTVLALDQQHPAAHVQQDVLRRPLALRHKDSFNEWQSHFFLQQTI